MTQPADNVDWLQEEARRRLLEEDRQRRLKEQRRRLQENRQRRLEESRAAELRQRLRTTPAGIGSEAWILWRPGADPDSSYSTVKSSVQHSKNTGFLTGLILSPIILILAALLTVGAFYLGAQWGISATILSLILVPAFTGSTLAKALNIKDDEESIFNGWVTSIDGQQCIASWSGFGGPFDHQSSAARRIVVSVQLLKDSYAVRSGWLSHDFVLRAHEEAWNRLIQARSASEEVREEYLSELAHQLEILAVDVARVDRELRSREKSGELQRLRNLYGKVEDRTAALIEDVQETRRFLDENPE